jgi:glutamate synthase (NADPH/NADH) large chain
MIENHVRYTDSERGQEILDNWEAYVDQFVKVMPDAYAAVVEDHLEDGEDIRVSPPEPATPAAAPTESDD